MKKLTRKKHIPLKTSGVVCHMFCKFEQVFLTKHSPRSIETKSENKTKSLKQTKTK